MKRNTPPSKELTREAREAYLLAGVGLAKGLWNVYIKPEATPSRSGVLAWTAIGMSALAYNLKCPQGQTLSETCDRGLAKHPALLLGGIAIVTAHLANVPDRFGMQQYDPIHVAFDVLKSAGNGK